MNHSGNRLSKNILITKKMVEEDTDIRDSSADDNYNYDGK
jgi:hypothetical protein